MTALGSVVIQAVVLLTGLVVVQGETKAVSKDEPRFSEWSGDVREDTQVGCVFGGSCVLPCRFQPNSDTILHWNKKNGKDVYVHSYYDELDQLGHQDPLYKGRTSLFHDQISGGNASLGLARVNLQDQGRYLCYASTSQNNQETFVTLTVRAGSFSTPWLQLGFYFYDTGVCTPGRVPFGRPCCGAEVASLSTVLFPEAGQPL
ncbi:unnamed protein product [Arctogadus glacialis]